MSWNKQEKFSNKTIHYRKHVPIKVTYSYTAVNIVIKNKNIDRKIGMFIKTYFNRFNFYHNYKYINIKYK